MWKRKHEPVVAESISIFSMMLHLLTNIPFVLYYLVIAENQDLRVWFTNIIGIIFFSFSLLTGIGFWVKDPGHSGLWQSCPETPTMSFAYERSDMGGRSRTREVHQSIKTGG
ncbi:MAG: hypothetical protein GDA43_15725 [Hormoscilla sp. SP5CHS1]|nr:hypothetical protein [Hormoscilla sp. SP12CHS1]MBC6454462.1 hypothetical protein [Hormoscilla sp. SP5CHS1]